MSKIIAYELIERVRSERSKGNNIEAYKDLQELITNYNQYNDNIYDNYDITERMIYNFDIWDEIGNIGYYVDKKDEARDAFKKLIELVEKQIIETKFKLKQHGERILNNISYYDCPEIYNKFSDMLKKINDNKNIIRKEVLRIAFHNTQLYGDNSEALYNYAYYNEKLLGNISIILYNKADKLNNKYIIDKLEKNFKCYSYNYTREIDDILILEEIDLIYKI